MKVQLEERTVKGKKNADLRDSGTTPVVCYGPREDSVLCGVKTKDLIKILNSDEVVFDTEGFVNDKKVLIQDVSFHPVLNVPTHVDFLFVDATHEVEHEVTIEIVGEAPGVKTHGGQLIVARDNVIVKALPQDIPGHLEIDISGLEEIHSHFTAGDIKLPSSVTLVTSPEEIIVSIATVQEEKEDETTNEINMDDIEVSSQKGKQEEGDPESADGDSGSE